MSGRNRERRGERAPETSDPSQYVFHYDRVERLGDRADRERPTGGIFKRNKSLLIVLLDIVLVMMMFLLYILFLRPEPGVVQAEGYLLDGEAFAFDEEVFVTVRIEPSAREDRAVPGGSGTGSDEGAEPPEGEASLVRLRFPDGTAVTDALPTDAEYPTVIRHVFGGEAADETSESEEVVVHVVLRGAEHELRIPLGSD
ncbi:MAG: hypothetical protein ACOCYX_01250 [Spirochaetota bacterium]